MFEYAEVKIFSEAGRIKGLGHFSRMSGLCEKLRRAGVRVQLYLDADEDIREILNREYVVFTDWITSCAAIRHISERDVVVVDSYHVDLEFLNRIREQCRDLIVIDDNIRLSYENMTIINPNYFGRYLNYPQDSGNTYYIGREYTLLREEFQGCEDRIISRDPKHVLITMGGTDLLDLTERVVRAVKRLDSRLRLHVVATEAFHHLDRIKDALEGTDELHMGASAAEMSELMKLADFAIASAGGTSNELIKMQLPATLIAVADNQRLNLKYLSEHGIVETFEIQSPERIGRMLSYEVRNMLFQNLKKEASQKCAADVVLEIAKKPS